MEKIYTCSSPSYFEYDTIKGDIKNGVARVKKGYNNPVNQVANITPTSDTYKGEDDLSKLTNGDLNSWVDLGNDPEDQNIVIDLGSIKTLRGVKIWGLFIDSRVYHDRIVQISEDNINWIQIFNNDNDNSADQGRGTSSEYVETENGKYFSVPSINAQYVRVWSGPDNKGGNAVLVEVEVYETTYYIDPVSFKTNEIVTANLLTSLDSMETPNGGEIKYNLIIDKVSYWYDGASWNIVDVLDFFKTNTLAEIVANWSQFTETNAPRYFQFMFWLLAMPEASDSPELASITFDFGLDLSVIPTPQHRIGFGYIYDTNGSPRAGVKVSAYLTGVNKTKLVYDDGTGNISIVAAVDDMLTYTNQYGYFALPFIITTKLVLAPSAKWILRTADGFQKQFTVDDTSMAPFNVGEK